MFPCYPTFSGIKLKSVLQTSLDPNLLDLKRLTTSYSVAAHKKYSCFSLNSLPSNMLSLGYSTREMFSAKLRSSTA